MTSRLSRTGSPWTVNGSIRAVTVTTHRGPPPPGPADHLCPGPDPAPPLQAVLGLGEGPAGRRMRPSMPRSWSRSVARISPTSSGRPISIAVAARPAGPHSWDRVRDEAVLPLDGALQPVEHGVERVRQFLQLVAGPLRAIRSCRVDRYSRRAVAVIRWRGRRTPPRDRPIPRPPTPGPGPRSPARSRRSTESGSRPAPARTAAEPLHCDPERAGGRAEGAFPTMETGRKCSIREWSDRAKQRATMTRSTTEVSRKSPEVDQREPYLHPSSQQELLRRERSVCTAGPPSFARRLAMILDPAPRSVKGLVFSSQASSREPLGATTAPPPASKHLQDGRTP